MPDAHVGYGLPIGGVLATEGAVVPFAVGVDIACRMKLSVFDLPVDWLRRHTQDLSRAIEAETRFGVGASFDKRRREHPVLDEDWTVGPVTRSHRAKAWARLGTSGSGNHCVEFGRLTIIDGATGLAPGEYLALLSHGGSRGTAGHLGVYKDITRVMAAQADLVEPLARFDPVVVKMAGPGERPED
ncbi:MAG: RtcB family protein [Opitutaceae bacterium]